MLIINRSWNNTFGSAIDWVCKVKMSLDIVFLNLPSSFCLKPGAIKTAQPMSLTFLIPNKTTKPIWGTTLKKSGYCWNYGLISKRSLPLLAGKLTMEVRKTEVYANDITWAPSFRKKKYTSLLPSLHKQNQFDDKEGCRRKWKKTELNRIMQNYIFWLYYRCKVDSHPHFFQMLFPSNNEDTEVKKYSFGPSQRKNTMTLHSSGRVQKKIGNQKVGFKFYE